MSDLAAVESVEIGLARCRRKAITFGDQLLVYLIDIAISQARTKSIALCAADMAQGERRASAIQEESDVRRSEALEMPTA